MVERFGSEGVILSHLLRGEDTDFFRPGTIDEPISQEMHLTYSINSTLTIASHLGQLLEEILATFKRTGLGCRKIVVTLLLDNGTEQSVTVAFDHLTASIDKFMRQFRQAMEKVALASPVCGLKVTIIDIGEIFAEQLRLRRDGGNRTDKSKDDLLNDDSITRPSLNPSFLPEEHYRLSPARDLKRRKQRRSGSEGVQRPKNPTSLGRRGLGRLGLAPGSADDGSRNVPQGLVPAEGGDVTLRHQMNQDTVGQVCPRPANADCRAGLSSNPPMAPKVTKMVAGPQGSSPAVPSKHASHVTLSGVEGWRGVAQTPDSNRNRNAAPTWYHPYCLNLIDGLRVLPHPYQIQVITIDERMATITTGQNRPHTVTRTDGPWRLSGHWWNGSYDRLYYEVETDDRRMYLMFFDRARSSWYMQGMFD